MARRRYYLYECVVLKTCLFRQARIEGGSCTAGAKVSFLLYLVLGMLKVHREMRLRWKLDGRSLPQ